MCGALGSRALWPSFHCYGSHMRREAGVTLGGGMIGSQSKQVFTRKLLWDRFLPLIPVRRTVPHALAFLVMFLFSCFALLLLLQCSLPLFSLCANILSKHLPLNTPECSIQDCRWITGMTVALVNCYHITCLNVLDWFAHQTEFTHVFSSPPLYSAVTNCVGLLYESESINAVWL